MNCAPAPYRHQSFAAWLIRPALAALILLCCLSVPPVFAAPDGTPATSSGRLAGLLNGGEPAPGSGEGKVGLAEHLGARLPRDATFRDENDRIVKLGDLVTMPTIIVPVYYSCPNVCSLTQWGLAKALPEVRLKPGEQFRVVSVSFDETETPELAHRSRSIYLDAMQGQFPVGAWSFLTGDSENIHRLLDTVGFGFRREGKDFLHPVAVIVVSGEGEIVRYLHGTTFLPMDLNLALVEASEGRIGPTIRRVAQFCFSYDPQSRRYVFNLFRVSAAVILLTAGTFLFFLIRQGRKPPEHPREK